MEPEYGMESDCGMELECEMESEWWNGKHQKDWGLTWWIGNGHGGLEMDIVDWKWTWWIANVESITLVMGSLSR